MRLFRIRPFVVAAFALFTFGCGGGGSPSPTTAALQPVPTSPPVVSAPSVRYYTEAVGPIVSALYFFSTPTVPALVAEYESGFYTNLKGEFYNSQPDAFVRSTFVFSRPLTSDQPEKSLSSVGIDLLTNLIHVSRSVKGSTVSSPMTTLVHDVGNEESVLYSLQLIAGSFPLFQNYASGKFAAASNFDGADTEKKDLSRRITAANLRVLVLNGVLDQIPLGGMRKTDDLSGATVTSKFAQGYALADFDPLSGFIKAYPQSKIFSVEGTLALVTYVADYSGRKELAPGSRAAIANLINRYVEAIGPTIDSESEICQFTLGIMGYLVPRVANIVKQNSDVLNDASNLVTAADIISDTVALRSVMPPRSGTLFAVTDFFFMKSGSQLVLQGSPTFSPNTTLGQNDINFEPGGMSQGVQPRALTQISVSSEQSRKISAILNADKSVTISAIAGFQGIAYFDYSESTDAGERAVGRAFVIVD